MIEVGVFQCHHHAITNHVQNLLVINHVDPCISFETLIIRITMFVKLGLFWHFETDTIIKTMDKITQILVNVVRCKYFEAGVHIKNPIRTHIKMV